MAEGGEERHEHELLTEWYRHSHDGGGDPHEHEHTPEEAEAHEEAAADDGSCPVCGVVHELAPDVQEELEQEEEPTAEEEPAAAEEPHPDEPEEVTGAPPQDEDERGPRRRVVTSAWHAHRRK